MSCDERLIAHLLSGSETRRTARAASVLREVGSLARLRDAGLVRWRELGLSERERQRLKTAFEVGARALVVREPGATIDTPQAAYACVGPELVGRDRECFVAVALDVKSRARAVAVIHEGSLEACSVDPRVVFRFCIAEGASGLLVAHNHPSGDPHPSADDLVLTEKLATGGEALGVPLVDHLVVPSVTSEGQPRFVSLAADGFLEAPRSRRRQRYLGVSR